MLSSDTQTKGSWKSSLNEGRLVAGAGFEPATFGL